MSEEEKKLTPEEELAFKICENIGEKTAHLPHHNYEKKEEKVEVKLEKIALPSKEFIAAVKQAYNNYFDKVHEQGQELLNNIKSNLPKLEELLTKINGHWQYEDLIYRFYHQSFKVYHIQGYTRMISTALESLAPEGVVFNHFYKNIFDEGTGKKFEISHNQEWEKHTRPMVEAFLHAKFFLEMAIKYGKELEEAPQCLPSGWAALLYFYNLR